MIVYLNRILFLWLFCITSAAVSGQPLVYDTIMQRICTDLQQSTADAGLATSVEKDLKTLAPNGSFEGLVYENHEFEHLRRVIDLATAYIRPGNKLYSSEKIFQAVIQSLQFWLDKNPHHKNWWFNEISYPQQIGQVLILMRFGKTPLPAALEDKLVERMTRKLRPGDGANTSDEALHYLYRACLTRNQALMDSAVTYLFEPVFINDDGEGLQVDNSYFQHGKQQAIASYGRVFVGNSYNAAYYLRGTQYAIPAQKLILLSSFFTDTYLKTIRGNFYDFNVRGRGISRKDSLGAGLANLVKKASLVDSSQPRYWQAAEARILGSQPAWYGVAPAHTHYWKSNYTLHNRPNYTFSVQTSSSRTLRTERGNNENIFGKFLPDGAANIQRRGGEYANIMPLWEWDKIPGVTNRDYPTDSGSTIRADWGIPGTSNFAGGVSDGQYGCTTYTLGYDSVQAHKAWFFFDKEVVCLGAGISSNTPENITTTINQCWLKGRVELIDKAGKKCEIKNSENPTYNAPRWLVHDSIGYYFPDGGNVGIATGQQLGNWYNVNHFQSKEAVRGDVFKLWLNHGAKPVNARYAYIVVPGISSAWLIKNYNASAVQIVQNNAAAQAILHSGLHMLQAVFYTAGSIACKGIVISVSKPCIVYIKNSDAANATLYIADPTQKLAEVEVRLKLPAIANTTIIQCSLPTGSKAGATSLFPVR